MGTNPDSTYRLDEIDRRIIHALMQDARNTSAAAIADEIGVSGATVRNRIAALEERGIIREYNVTVDFEQAGGALMSIFYCQASRDSIEAIARKIGTIPGVINARELIGTRANLHVLAVGSNTTELRQIGRKIERLDVEVVDEALLQNEFDFPYTPFAPDKRQSQQPLTDYVSLTGGAEVVEMTVREGAPIADYTVHEAVEADLLDDEALIIAVERDDEILTPHGDTTIQINDIVTILLPEGSSSKSVEAFDPSKVVN